MLVNKIGGKKYSYFYWREKLLELAQLSPESFVMLKFSPDNFLKVLEENPIPNFRQFNENLYYFVCTKNKVAGVFKGKLLPKNNKHAVNTAKTNHEILLTNLTNYEISVEYNNKLTYLAILKKLEQKNYKFDILLMRFEINNTACLLSIASKKLTKLVENYWVNNEELIEINKISATIHKALNFDETKNQQALFHEISVLGTKLEKIISLNKILRSNHLTGYNIFLSNTSNIPLQTINHTITQNKSRRTYYPLIEQALTHIPSQHDPENDSSYNLESIAVVNMLQEENAYEEVNSIRESLEETPRLANYPVIFQNNNALLEQLHANTECIHIIAHGEQVNSGIQELKKTVGNKLPLYFNKNTFLSYKKMPVFLFLSICHSDDPAVVSHFFKYGGRAAITVNGLLFNHGLHIYIGKFYKNIFAGETIQMAFQNMVESLLNDKNPNCFRFKLYGNSEKLFF